MGNRRSQHETQSAIEKAKVKKIGANESPEPMAYGGAERGMSAARMQTGGTRARVLVRLVQHIFEVSVAFMIEGALKLSDRAGGQQFFVNQVV